MENILQKPQIYDFNKLENYQSFTKSQNLLEKITIKDISWWSNEAIILLWSNGNLTINHIHDQSNLIGKSAERFEINSQLSEASKEINFYILETKKKEKQTKIINHVQLIEFHSVTPIEFIKKKIQNNQFNDALELAQYYDIDNDFLYQYKWEIVSEISIDSLQSCFDPIQNRLWILDQCIHHVPQTFNETLLLYIYGIYETVPKDFYINYPFINWKNDLNFEKIFEKLILPSLHEENNNDANILYYYRLILLHYLDRLYIYHDYLKNLNGNENSSHSDDDLIGFYCFFNSFEFNLFKDCKLDIEAFKFSSLGFCSPLRSMFSLSKQVFDKRIEILNEICITIDPEEYYDILPCIHNQSSIYWREIDFSEKPEHFNELLTKSEKSHIKNLEIFISKPKLENSYTYDQIIQFYIQLAQKIDFETGFTSNSEKLLKFIIEKDFSNQNNDKEIENQDQNYIQCKNKIENFYKNFQIYSNIVYASDSSIDWNLFQKYNDFDILKKLLNSSNEKSIAIDLYKNCFTLIEQSNEKLKNIEINEKTDIKQWILIRYLIENAKKENLMICSSILQSISNPPSVEQCHTSNSIEKLDFYLIPSEILFIRTALDCVYLSNSTDQWNEINCIYNSIPERDPNEENSYYQNLHDQVDELEIHLQASELLNQYSISFPLHTFLHLNANSASQLIQKICIQAGKTSKKLNDKDWLEILSVILDLRSKIFDFISIDFCYSCFCEALLYQNNIKLAQEYLIKTSKAPQIILKISKELFNSSTNIDDENFKNSEKILSILDHENFQHFKQQQTNSSPSSSSSSEENYVEKIREEINLHKATRLLFNQFDYRNVPIQIRLADKNQLIKSLIHSSSSAYLNPDCIIEIINLFDPNGKSNARQNEIFKEITDVAFLNNNFEYSIKICYRLIEKNYKNAWDCALRLGFAPSSSFISHDDRIYLLQFSLCYCPKEKIHLILAKINHLKCIDKIIDDNHSFNDLLSSPLDTHNLLKQKMISLVNNDQKSSNSIEYLHLDSLFVTTLYDYHVIHSGIIPMIDTSQDLIRIESLLNSSIMYYKEQNYQSSICFFYQSIMCSSFLPKIEKLLEEKLFLISNNNDHDDDDGDSVNIDKQWCMFIQIICFCFGVRYLLHCEHNNDDNDEINNKDLEENNCFTLKSLLDKYSLIDILQLVSNISYDNDNHDSDDDDDDHENNKEEQHKYLSLFHKFHKLLEQGESSYFMSEIIPHSFNSLEELEVFCKKMLHLCNSIENVKEFQLILEKWSSTIPLPNYIVNNLKNENQIQENQQETHEFHILHCCWFEFFYILIQLNEFQYACEIIIRSDGVLTLDEEIKIQNLILQQNDNSLFWRLKIGLLSNYTSIRDDSLELIIKELLDDKNKEKNLCDSKMAHVIMLHSFESSFDKIIYSPCFYNAVVQLVLENTVWDTSVPSLCGLAYPKDGHVVCSLPFFIATLVKLGLVENAASIICSALRIPNSFSGWTNSMFILVKFLENQQASSWKENASHVIPLIGTSFEHSFWDECVELCKSAVNLIFHSLLKK